MKTNTKVPKTPFFAAFSVGAVLFSAHAGGGFATGNQANTYYVGLGWTGIISAIAAMLLLTLTMREAMIMYNSRGLTSYKQLFETLYHPFDKIEWAFEVFFYIMVLMAVAAAISGAASALNNYFMSKGPDYAIMISDALMAKGTPVGSKYLFGGNEIIIYPDGSAHLTATGGLAGSTLNINKGLRILVEEALVPFNYALNSCTINPAKCLHLDDRKGSIQVGKDADLVVLEDNYDVLQTYCMGQPKL